MYQNDFYVKEVYNEKYSVASEKKGQKGQKGVCIYCSLTIFSDELD